uniref:Uncharacterized protein n=1 Tax=Sparus aurata TaxID=8175 RepID=A0A671U336_SPAAU
MLDHLQGLQCFSESLTLTEVLWSHSRHHHCLQPEVQESLLPQVQESLQPQVQESLQPQVQESLQPQVQESLQPQVQESLLSCLQSPIVNVYLELSSWLVLVHHSPVRQLLFPSVHDT